MNKELFTTYPLGEMELPSRIVLSPMTRNRATDNVPNELMVEYYSQRAGAGLIVTEGTAPSPNGLGYPRIPGIFSEGQIAAWRLVTDAVHAKGGHIFMQLMHTGRIGHPDNLPPGAEVVGPSAIAAKGEMYTDSKGLQPHPVPRAMTRADINEATGEFAQAARNAVAAGFDGVELHGANGYLIDQFLNPAANQRDDAYGRDATGRNRFAIEVATAVVKAIGKDRVGIRLSPYGVFNDLEIFDGIEAQYTALVSALSELGLAYVHLVDHSSLGAPKPATSTVEAIRNHFRGTLILSGGYDRARAEADLERGLGDLVAFGRLFLSNPDLPQRLLSGAPLNDADFATFYTPGEKGYTDYPALTH